jgi:glycerol kinase
MARYVMAIDQGTTSSKAFIINKKGAIIGQGAHEITQFYPHPGWVEHDPIEIWATQKQACVDAMRNAQVSINDIECIGITNQRETAVIWERNTGKPITHAIVWQCRRTLDICNDLIESGKGLLIKEKTGLVIDPYFSATKVKWILQSVPGAMEMAVQGALCFGTIDSWLLYNLTGGRIHGTDPSNASRTMLFNISTMDWDDDILEWLSIPDSILPTIIDTSAVCSVTDKAIFDREVPIGAIAGDQQAALFGQRCFEQGSIKNTYGTGCFLLVNTGNEIIRSTSGLVSSIGWRIDGHTSYVLEGSVFIGGAAVQWLRDGLGVIKSSADIEALARTVLDSDGVYFLPAFVGLGAPYWDSGARGIIVGITGGTTSGHLARATLEAIAQQSADVVFAAESDWAHPFSELRVDGGATQNGLLMQFQADIIGIDLVRSTTVHTTALGVAFLAGLATGFWSGFSEIQKLSLSTQRFSPTMTENERNQKRKAWQKIVTTARIWSKEDQI